MTAAGRVELIRRSMRCPSCGPTACLLDERVGPGGFLSPQANRLACLAAASWSFDVASDRLDEFAGLRLDGETIRRHVHRAAGVLDIFHASQHIAAAAALHGEGTAGASGWLEGCRSRLLADGWEGLLDHVGVTASGAMTTAGRAAPDEMIGYFAAHADRVGYFGRLRLGQSIGSGAVEGMARRLGRRLKVPGRGWCVGHSDGMAALTASVDTPEWDGLPARPAA